jgi:hypothetical protein
MPGSVTSIWGPEKTNKTGLSLTWPTPIRHYDFDMGFERASYLGSYQDKKQMILDGAITWLEMPAPIHIPLRLSDPLKGFRELWAKFVQDILEHLTANDVETYVIDTGTKCWSLCHTAYLQELQEKQIPLQPNQKLRERLQPIEYAEPNSRMQAVWQAPKSRGKNLVVIHHQGAVYGTRFNSRGETEEFDTGEKQQDGFRKAKDLTDIELRTNFRNRDGVWVPSAKVTLCGLTMSMLGMEIDNPSYDLIFEAVERMRS